MRIAYIGGSWSSNIGNAFYNLGMGAFLNSLPNIESYFVPDPPQWKEDVKTDFDLISNLDVDLVILSGPCLNYNLPKIYTPIFKKLQERGVKFGFVSTGMSQYEEGEAKHIKEFFSKYKPSFLFTRDSDSYSFYKDIEAFPVYDGLCTSMFLNDAVKVPALALEEYYVTNFDHVNDPTIKLNKDGSFDITAKSSIWGKQDKIGEHRIIRTNNCSITDGYKKIYSKPDTYHSDLPAGYLSLLKQAKVVFSERVHTCAATLILGGTAQFIPVAKRSFEKRSRLFDRVQLSEIVNKPVQLNFDYLNAEKEKMRTAFMSVLEKIK